MRSQGYRHPSAKIWQAQGESSLIALPARVSTGQATREAVSPAVDVTPLPTSTNLEHPQTGSPTSIPPALFLYDERPGLTTRFSSKPYIIRVPFFLLSCFNKDTPKQKGEKGTTGVPRQSSQASHAKKPDPLSMWMPPPPGSSKLKPPAGFSLIVPLLPNLQRQKDATSSTNSDRMSTGDLH